MERRVRCVDDLASEARTDASRADLDAREDRNFDLSTFEAWFGAYVADDQEAMAIAERRFRPEFAVAFDAWRATNPETNPAAPRGPTYMPQYRQPGLEQAKVLDEKADEAFAAGVSAGQTSENYVRATVFLASVLFLVGISAHFPGRGARYGLIALERRAARRLPRAARRAASTALVTEGSVARPAHQGPSCAVIARGASLNQVMGLVHVWSTRHRSRAVRTGLQRHVVLPGHRCNPGETSLGQTLTRKRSLHLRSCQRFEDFQDSSGRDDEAPDLPGGLTLEGVGSRSVRPAGEC